MRKILCFAGMMIMLMAVLLAFSGALAEDGHITLTMTPETPVIGEEVTIRWEIECMEFGGCELSIALTSGEMTKSYYPSDMNHGAKIGSYTFIPTEGEELSIFLFVYYGSDLDGFGENLGPVALQGEGGNIEPIEVNVSYNSTSLQMGETITADYEITGGSGKFSSINAEWVRLDRPGEAAWLQSSTVEETSGELSYVPETAGKYGLVFYYVEDENGWSISQNPSDLTSLVTVTAGDNPSQPEGPETILLLPESLQRIESEAFADIKNVGIYIPKTVTYIAEDAFDSSVTILCEAGCYAENRCREELGLEVVPIEWGNG